MTGRRITLGLTVALLIGVSALQGRGQSIDELRARCAAVQRRIEETNRLIRESSDSTKTNLARIALLESQIETKNALLQNL